MHVPAFVKYGFRIRTRVGLPVDNLMIHGCDEQEAQRKLRQMYPGCEILECTCHRGKVEGGRFYGANFEDVVSLIVQ